MKNHFKILSVVLSMVFIFSSVSLFSANAEGEYVKPDKFIYGDVNQDGEVTVKDVTYIQKGLAEIHYVNAVQRFLADPDNEGFSIKNATAIQKYLAQYETETPWGEEILMATKDEFSSKLKINDPKMENSLRIRPKNNTHSYCVEDFPELEVYKIETTTFMSGEVYYELFLYSDTEAELLEAVKKIDYRANIDLGSVEFCLTLATVDEV